MLKNLLKSDVFWRIVGLIIIFIILPSIGGIVAIHYLTKPSASFLIKFIAFKTGFRVVEISIAGIFLISIIGLIMWNNRGSRNE